MPLQTEIAKLKTTTFRSVVKCGPFQELEPLGNYNPAAYKPRLIPRKDEIIEGIQLVINIYDLELQSSEALGPEDRKLMVDRVEEFRKIVDAISYIREDLDDLGLTTAFEAVKRRYPIRTKETRLDMNI